jgi:hypothetical protein
VISSPANYRDVQHELISVIHRTSIWPLVVTVDGNIRIPDKSDFIDRDGSYIVLIPDGNIESFKTEINRLAEGPHGYTRLWNSEARFVVAGANDFSMKQQMEIFEHFSKLRIYNCIIVSQQHDVLDEEYSRPIKLNDVNAGMKLVVYTWFPYQSSDRCTEVNDISLLDSWVISAQGHLTKNNDLFPRKMRNSLSGCPMKAVVLDGNTNDTTNYIYHTDSNGNIVLKLVGLEMDLLWVVLQQMNMILVHIPTPENLTFMKGILSDDLFWAMISKEAFIALGDLKLDII